MLKVIDVAISMGSDSRSSVYVWSTCVSVSVGDGSRQGRKHIQKREHTNKKRLTGPRSVTVVPQHSQHNNTCLAHLSTEGCELRAHSEVSQVTGLTPYNGSNSSSSSQVNFTRPYEND